MSDNIYNSLFSQSNTEDQPIYYLIYQTTNLINNKIYIGQHITKNIDDGYLGSGKLLKLAIEKYGSNNFKYEILFQCSSREDLDLLESQIVNEEFVSRKDTYNLTLGGGGGWYYVNQDSSPNNKFRGKRHSEETKAKISAKSKGRKIKKSSYNLSEEGRKRISETSAARMANHKPTAEVKAKISASLKNRLKDPILLQQQQDRMRQVQSLRPKEHSPEYKKSISQGLKAAYESGKRKSRDWTPIQQDIDLGLTGPEIIKKYNLPRDSIRIAYRNGKITSKPRKARDNPGL